MLTIRSNVDNTVHLLSDTISPAAPWPGWADHFPPANYDQTKCQDCVTSSVMLISKMLTRNFGINMKACKFFWCQFQSCSFLKKSIPWLAILHSLHIRANKCPEEIVKYVQEICLYRWWVNIIDLPAVLLSDSTEYCIGQLRLPSSATCQHRFTIAGNKYERCNVLTKLVINQIVCARI